MYFSATICSITPLYKGSHLRITTNITQGGTDQSLSSLRLFFLLWCFLDFFFFVFREVDCFESSSSELESEELECRLFFFVFLFFLFTFSSSESLSLSDEDEDDVEDEEGDLDRFLGLDFFFFFSFEDFLDFEDGFKRASLFFFRSFLNCSFIFSSHWAKVLDFSLLFFTCSWYSSQLGLPGRLRKSWMVGPVGSLGPAALAAAIGLT